jgi:hypothetical protein
LITIISSFFLSNPILSTIQGQTSYTTPPIIVVPQDIVEEATGPNGAQVSFEEASAQDDVDGPVGVTCDRNSGGTFPVSETVVTCIAEDLAGNRAQEPFLITVQEAPSDDIITRLVEWLLSSTNDILLVVLASIGIVVVGILLVKYHNDRKNSRSRRIKISPSSIVEIRSKGGMRE